MTRVKWLVTIGANTDRHELETAVASLGGQVLGYQAPMADGETVVDVEAPTEVKARIRQIQGVTGVFPNSTLTLYNDTKPDVPEG